jgi:hypothetical protein
VLNPETPRDHGEATNESVTHSSNQCVGAENVPWRPKKFVSRRPHSDVLSRRADRRRTALERPWRGGSVAARSVAAPAGHALGLFCDQLIRSPQIVADTVSGRIDVMPPLGIRVCRNHLDGALIAFLGVDPPDAADHAGAELFLDATHRRRITVGPLKLSNATRALASAIAAPGRPHGRRVTLGLLGSGIFGTETLPRNRSWADRGRCDLHRACNRGRIALAGAPNSKISLRSTDTRASEEQVGAD